MAPYRAAVIRRIALIQSSLRGSPDDTNGEDRGTRNMRPANRTAIHWVEVAGVWFVLAGIAALYVGASEVMKRWFYRHAV